MDRIAFSTRGLRGPPGRGPGPGSRRLQGHDITRPPRNLGHLEDLPLEALYLLGDRTDPCIGRMECLGKCPPGGRCARAEAHMSERKQDRARADAGAP